MWNFSLSVNAILRGSGRCRAEKVAFLRPYITVDIAESLRTDSHRGIENLH